MSLLLPPLSLYIHLPWCVAKCPYCDFNSHALVGELPEDRYNRCLAGRSGTGFAAGVGADGAFGVSRRGDAEPCFSGESMAPTALGCAGENSAGTECRKSPMEANPGTVEHDRFEAYREAGINRISLGIQTFSDSHLKTLGRIHDGNQAARAVEAVKAAGFSNSQSRSDVGAAPRRRWNTRWPTWNKRWHSNRPHLSHYQLTIEPNTVFAARPPPLPDDEEAMGYPGSLCRAPGKGRLFQLRNIRLVTARSSQSAQSQLTGASAITWASAPAPTARSPCRPSNR